MDNPIKTKRMLWTGLALSLLGIIAGFILRDASLAKVQRSNLVRIGYAIEAPYAYLAANGRITGESPEVARVIVARLGIDKIEWVQTDFDRLIPGLLEDRFDVIAAGMFITPERAMRVRFSSPTFHVQPGLLVSTGNPLQLYAYQDIVANPTVTVAVISGSVEESVLREMSLADSQFLIVPDARTGQTAVAAGLADALALSSVTVRWMAANDTTGQIAAVDISLADVPTTTVNWGYGGFVFRPDDQRLATAWDAAQAAFIGSPEHINLIAQFGFTSAELPGDMTTAKINQP